MDLTPKKKSDVQLNGYEKPSMNWASIFTKNFNAEFNDRYNDIIKKYEELTDEIYWNNIIYNLDIKFKPVIGNTYYLYNNDQKYCLSMISPSEWGHGRIGTQGTFIAEFQFNYNGKWIKN
jgi:hypothetical protein